MEQCFCLQRKLVKSAVENTLLVYHVRKVYRDFLIKLTSDDLLLMWSVFYCCLVSVVSKNPLPFTALKFAQGRQLSIFLSSLCSPLCPFPNLLLKVHKPEQVGEKDKSYPSLLCKQSCFCKQFISLTEPLLGKKIGSIFRVPSVQEYFTSGFPLQWSVTHSSVASTEEKYFNAKLDICCLSISKNSNLSFKVIVLKAKSP